MKKVRLGKTNLQVSRVGMGGIPILLPPFDTAVKVIERALDLGINLIDTSVYYDDSELRIGRAIKGYREDIVVVTKSSWQSAKRTQNALEKSLKQLNTDYIDIWLFHNVSTEDAYNTMLRPNESLKVANAALESGKVHHLGLSTHSLAIAQKATTSRLFEVILFPFNFVTNHAEQQLVPLAKTHDVGFLAMKPFAGGQLTDADLAIKYLLQFDNVVPVPGIETVENIEEIVEIVEGSWELTPKDWQRIEEIRTQQGSKLCMWCEYCKPCPKEINIPWVMNIESMWILWGKAGFPGRMLKHITKGRECDQCGECEDKCPYQLNIRETLVKQIEYYDRIIQSQL
ncbi:MAG: aldo/keto reductase [Candidatus Thorarchaeota archaeon]